MEFDHSEHYPIGLDHLPKGWEVAWVGDLCESIQAGFATGEHNSDGVGVPHLRPMNVDRGGRLDLTEVKCVQRSSDTRRLARGDVLFNNTNSPLLVGKTCPIMTDQELAFSNHMTRLRPRKGIDTRFLAHELHYLWMAGFFLHKCQKHVNQASISTEVLAWTVPLAVPPTPEQHRIVAAIESYFSRLDEAVALLERVQRNLKRYRASVLKAAVEGRLVPTEAALARAEGRSYEPASVLLGRILEERRRRWKAEGGKGTYKEPVAPDTTDLPELPEGWCWATVEQIGDPSDQAVLTGPFGTTLSRSDFQSEGVPVLTIGCLTNGGLSLDKAVYLSEEKAAALSRYSLREGDVLFSRMATVGRAGVVETSLEGALFNYHIMRLRLEDKIMLPLFFLAYVRGSAVVNDYVKAVNHGATRDGINTEQLLRLPVPIPPLAEQHRAVAEIERLASVTDETIRTTQAGLRRAARLRQSILKWAFEGRLADQDPTDEPASVLLERIRAERNDASRNPIDQRGRRRRLGRPAAVDIYSSGDGLSGSRRPRSPRGSRRE